MNYTKEEVLNLVKKVLPSDLTGLYIGYNNYEYDEPEEIISNLKTHSYIESINGVDVFNGITKVVLVPSNKDYVIKMNVSGVYCKNEDEDEYADLILIKERCNNIDILEMENELYEKSSERVRKILLPNIYIGTYLGIKIYIQEKIESTYYELYACGFGSPTISAESKEKIRKITGGRPSRGVFGEAFLERLFEQYDFETVKSMIKEIWENEIGMDMHSKNYGFMRNGRCVVFDFGGYDDEIWWNDI